MGKSSATPTKALRQHRTLVAIKPDAKIASKAKRDTSKKKQVQLQQSEYAEKERVIRMQIDDNIKKINATLDALPITATKKAQYEQLLRIQSACLTRLELLIEYEERLDVVAKVYQTISQVIDNIDEPLRDARQQNFFESLADKVYKNSEYVEFEDV